MSAAEGASEQSGASERVSGARERANGRASGPVLTSRFLFVPDHSALISDLAGRRCRQMKHTRRFSSIHAISLKDILTFRMLSSSLLVEHAGDSCSEVGGGDGIGDGVVGGDGGSGGVGGDVGEDGSF